MLKFNYSRFFLFCCLIFLFSACRRAIPSFPFEESPYENGFFIVNEGWYGNASGSLSFYSYTSNTINDSAYFKANPRADLGGTSSNLEFGTIFDDKVYLLGKSGAPMVAADSYTLKETGRLGGDYNSFVGLNSNTALVSSPGGLYNLDLPSMTLGNQVAGIQGPILDLIKTDQYIFALSIDKGVYVLNANDFSIVKIIGGLTMGFTKTANNSVWATSQTRLVEIKPSLDTAGVAIPFELYGSSQFSTWHPGSITASANDVYLIGTENWSARVVYKYTGSAASLATPFFTLPDNQEFYGQGIAFDPTKQNVVCTAVQTGWGDNYSYNHIYFYDPATGSKTSEVFYSGFYFPAAIFFQ